MIKAIFTEVNDLGLNVTIGEKVLDTPSIEVAHNQAKSFVDILKQIKNDTVSYMLEKNGGIIAVVNL